MSTNTFNTDFPFDQISEMPTLDDPGVARLTEFVGIFPHKASATRYGFQKFCRLLADVTAPWKGALVEFTESIMANAYRGEFGQRHNQFAGGACANGECSQTSELFSLFTQAAHYDDGGGNDSDAIEVTQA